MARQPPQQQRTVRFKEPMTPPRRAGFWGVTLQLLVFHILNFVLGLVGFVAVVVGFTLGIALVPLCCLGILAFRLAFVFLAFLAQIDVALFNFISPTDEHVYINVPGHNDLFAWDLRLAPNLSSGSFFIAIYFFAVKLVLVLLSFIALAITIGFPIAILVSDPTTQHKFFGSFWSFVLFLAISMFSLLVGSAFMTASASLSRTATRFFCCEKFSVTYEHVADADEPTYQAVEDDDVQV
ncbi:hypothetical protein Poli38472_002831 [Pythium oligandrum]|uniref:Uncharacterized protein n=1 Tax=Pythium oligandrum TaxID=41045 RepID=A0A8K1C5P1_PYTOL|nr:hypothetical protein Poli38472_002831 [Pythium oligandrum]|eukprot:TMW56906.1 hypothetical protein Poli38472_002831 [Pythium oligandrum]